MSSIRSIVSRIWRILEGGTPTDDSRFTYLEIRDHVRSAIFSALKQNYFEARNSEGDYKYGNDDITVSSLQEVQSDPDGGMFYIDVSGVDSISVPATNRLISISDPNPYSRASKTYASVRSEERFIGMLQPPIPCTVLYERNGDKIYFYNDTIKVGHKVRLNQKYVITDNDDEELNIPPEHELQIVDSVSRLLDRELRIRDISNDGVPEPINRL